MNDPVMQRGYRHDPIAANWPRAFHKKKSKNIIIMLDGKDLKSSSVLCDLILYVTKRRITEKVHLIHFKLNL